MQHHQLIHVVHALRVRRTGRVVAVVHRQRLGFCIGLQLGQHHPDKRQVIGRVEFLDLVLERRRVIACHKADIRAIYLAVEKAEIAGMQAHQQRHLVERLAGLCAA